MPEPMKKNSYLAVFQLAGAFIAGMIGSGFATGQEVLQFFSSYGRNSYPAVLLCFLIILLVGHGLLRAGLSQQNNPDFQCLVFFCKKPLGTVYLVLLPVFLLIILAVMVAGAGATVYEYFGLSRPLGSLLIVFFALIAYLLGFRRLVGIVSTIAPLIIVFLLLVGIVSIIKGLPDANAQIAYFPALEPMQPNPSWLLSAISYASMNIIVNAPYYAQLGVTASCRKAVDLGTIFGSIALALTIAITNTAILLFAKNAAQFDIPVLFLARQISPVLGFLFCIFLLLGIFSACSTTMWTICHQLCGKNERRGKFVCVFIALLAYALSFVPFSRLIAVLYPLIGYFGIAFVAFVIFYELKSICKKPS